MVKVKLKGAIFLRGRALELIVTVSLEENCLNLHLSGCAVHVICWSRVFRQKVAELNQSVIED